MYLIINLIPRYGDLETSVVESYLLGSLKYPLWHPPFDAGKDILAKGDYRFLL